MNQNITHEQLDNLFSKCYGLVDADGDFWFPDTYGDYDLNGDICILHSPALGDMRVDVNTIDLKGNSLMVDGTIFQDNGEEQQLKSFLLTPLRSMSVSDILSR